LHIDRLGVCHQSRLLSRPHPESKGSALRATLHFSLSHWVQGSPLPPAAQAINFLMYSPLLNPLLTA
jgi:hypothetical protein